jgi:hypothetical protein
MLGCHRASGRSWKSIRKGAGFAARLLPAGGATMTPLELLAVAVWIWDLPWLQILMVIGIWFAAWIFRIMFTSVTETYATVRRIERELRALDVKLQWMEHRIRQQVDANLPEGQP